MSDGPGEVFGRIYDTGHWTGGSGQGSRAAVTATYRRILEIVAGARDVRSVVDAGCGDWEFSRLVDWGGVRYLGLDAVEEVVRADQERFGGPRTSFRCVDLHSADLPPADALICKDVLQHWPRHWISDLLARAAGRYRYLLLTNDLASVHWPDAERNAEIELGAWRTLDLEHPDFGVRAAWRHDYDVQGEWTKRVLLVVDPRYLPVARRRPGSALRRLRGQMPEGA